MDRLSIPSNVYIGNKNELIEELLNELKGKRILVFVTVGNTERLGLDDMIRRFKEEMILTVINEVPPTPTYIDLHKILNLCKGNIFDAVVAIGGGSIIDMAKSYVGLKYLSKDSNLNKELVLEAIKNKQYLSNKESIPIYAIPTTAGTGSEVTHWATVWDIEGKAKYSVDSEHLSPQKAYIIPEFALTMPKRLTLATGLDALCQAVEAYWAKSTNPMVKELSKVAIRLIVEYLPEVLQNGDNIRFRQKMALGSLFSGLAFSNTRTTACHSISYPLTLLFGIEHGLACIVTLPKVMEKNLKALEDVEELTCALRIKSADELHDWINSISEGIVNLKLNSFGVTRKDVEELVRLSFTLGRMDNNPVDICPEDVREILEEIL